MIFMLLSFAYIMTGLLKQTFLFGYAFGLAVCFDSIPLHYCPAPFAVILRIMTFTASTASAAWGVTSRTNRDALICAIGGRWRFFRIGRVCFLHIKA